MNNKTIKRIVALVATVLMLCTCAFAAEISSLSYDAETATISMGVDFADDGNKGLYIAYAANKADAETAGAVQIGEDYYVLGTIISVFQAEGSFYELTEHSEPIVAEYLDGYDSIVLRAGDNGAESLTAAAYAAEIPVLVTEYTITFANEDGTVLETVTVEAGETPEYAGETPTKAANEKYTYTFAGWTPEIVAATEDAIYTATYTETAREYTVVFYDEDGVTVLDEQRLVYGATPVYAGVTPTKEADAEFTYEFAGWTPEIGEVTADATYTAVFNATAIPSEPAVVVTFVNGAETVEVEAVDGVAIAPAAPTAPTPGADALISSYEFVGWTDADSTVTYETGDSIPATEEFALYAKYQMYNTWKDKVVKWGDIDGNGFVTAADVSELIYYFDDDTQCGYTDVIKAKIDEDNMGRASYGDIDGNNFVTAADVSELIYYFDDDTQCGYTDIIKTPIYFINLD